MKNIPNFTTPWGIASLILEEIPYRQEAFVRIQAAEQSGFSALLEECVGFCRAAGAQRVRAAGHPALQSCPVYATLIRMRRERSGLAAWDCGLWPLLAENAEEFRKYYNQRMAGVPNAATLTQAGIQKLLKDGGGYFVHRDGRLLGLGIVSDDEIKAVIALEPGAGECVLRALASVPGGQTVELTVANENLPAMKLYTRLGFLPVEEVARWYTVLANLE